MAVALLGLAGCADAGLGECDTNALTMDMLQSMPHHGGQAQIEQSCASGSCHSAAAKGEARTGVPEGLNFDLVPLDGSDAELTKVSRGMAKVDELAEEMWSQIEAGTMPPESKRTALTADQKETVRNWLACGAPVINQPAAPVDDNWNAIYGALTTSCIACHGGGMPNAGSWYAANDACQTRTNLLGAATGEDCDGMGMLVVPNQPDMSILLSKLETPLCGDPMPPPRTVDMPSTLAASMRAWIAAGAMADCP